MYVIKLLLSGCFAAKGIGDCEVITLKDVVMLLFFRSCLASVNQLFLPLSKATVVFFAEPLSKV